MMTFLDRCSQITPRRLEKATPQLQAAFDNGFVEARDSARSIAREADEILELVKKANAQITDLVNQQSKRIGELEKALVESEARYKGWRDLGMEFSERLQKILTP